MSDVLKSFSDALAQMAAEAAPLLVTLYPGQRAQRAAMPRELQATVALRPAA